MHRNPTGALGNGSPADSGVSSAERVCIGRPSSFAGPEREAGSSLGPEERNRSWTGSRSSGQGSRIHAASTNERERPGSSFTSRSRRRRRVSGGSSSSPGIGDRSNRHSPFKRRRSSSFLSRAQRTSSPGRRTSTGISSCRTSSTYRSSPRSNSSGTWPKRRRRSGCGSSSRLAPGPRSSIHLRPLRRRMVKCRSLKCLSAGKRAIRIRVSPERGPSG